MNVPGIYLNQPLAFIQGGLVFKAVPFFAETALTAEGAMC